MPAPKLAIRRPLSNVDTGTRLAGALRARLEEEQENWDGLVTGREMTGVDLWASMPAVDSKTVARMAPIFEEHEGCPFNVRRIRAGGYASIDEAVQHLVYGK